MTRRTKGATMAKSVVQPLPVIIEFLLDETGSMDSIKQSAIAGFNDFLREQRNASDTALFTLTKFDSSGLRTPYVDLDVKMVPELTINTFCPGATTNLRDAIVERSNALSHRLSTWTMTPHVLFICLTDGGDNASRFSEEYVRNVLGSRMESGWTYAYLGANQNAIQVGMRMGFPEGNCKTFAVEEVATAMHDVSASTTAYRAARSAAVATYSTSNYFSG